MGKPTSSGCAGTPKLGQGQPVLSGQRKQDNGCEVYQATCLCQNTEHIIKLETAPA